MTQLEILCDTVLKQEPQQSTKLTDDQKQFVKAGSVFTISGYKPESDHVKVTFSEQTFKGRNTWYVYQRHGAIVNGDTIIFPQSVKLNLPYFDQLDNSENPYGSCNVTSISMCLAYLGALRKRPSERMPDELQDYCAAHNLDRHVPQDLAQVVQAYGCKDHFTQKATFKQVKEWLIQGNPAVTHGYFTRSGHVVAIVGYNDQGFIVNDPYGELMYDPPSSYYNTYASGRGLTYSYNLIQNTCVTGGEFWVHFISR